MFYTLGKVGTGCFTDKFVGVSFDPFRKVANLVKLLDDSGKSDHDKEEARVTFVNEMSGWLDEDDRAQGKVWALYEQDGATYE